MRDLSDHAPYFCGGIRSTRGKFGSDVVSIWSDIGERRGVVLFAIDAANLLGSDWGNHGRVEFPWKNIKKQHSQGSANLKELLGSCESKWHAGKIVLTHPTTK